MTTKKQATKAKSAVEKVKALQEALDAFRNGEAGVAAEAVLDALAEAVA